jgi:hypothetical protein
MRLLCKKRKLKKRQWFPVDEDVQEVEQEGMEMEVAQQEHMELQLVEHEAMDEVQVVDEAIQEDEVVQVQLHGM